MAFQHRAKEVVIIFCVRSTSHYHELMISLVTHRIAPAPSVSPLQTPPPAPLDPTIVVFPQEPPERLVSSIPQEPPERQDSPLPQLTQETNPFQGEP